MQSGTGWGQPCSGTRQEVQRRSGDITHLHCQKMTQFLGIYEIFQPPSWEALFPTPGKNYIVLVSSIQFTSSPSLMLVASSLPGGPGFLQAAHRPSQAQRDRQGQGVPCTCSHTQHGNTAPQDAVATVPSFPAAPRGGQKPCRHLEKQDALATSNIIFF